MLDQSDKAPNEHSIALDAIDHQVFYLIDEETYGDVNVSHAEFMGMPKAKLARKKLSELLTENELKICVEGNRKVFEEKKQVKTLEWVTDGKGEKRLLKITKNPCFDEKGNVKYVVCLAEDVTALKKSEEERSVLEKHLRRSEKFEAIGRLAGVVAHDLNNMLMPIRVCAEMLADELCESDPGKKELQNIIQSAERADELTRKLIAVGDRHVLDLKSLNLSSVLRDFADILRFLLREDIELELIEDDELKNINADESDIRMVIMNLALHAQNVTPGGGKIFIKTANVNLDESCREKCPEAAPGPYALLSVSDSGGGLSPEAVEHLFDPFWDETRNTGGIGLSMQAARSIVNQHGGFIDVINEPGRGATIDVYLPAIPDAPENRQPTAEKPRTKPAAETILVAEEDKLVRGLICNLLNREGYNVFSGATLEECKKLARAYKGEIHLLITDVVMPLINGRQLYEMVSSVRPGIKVIYISGHNDNIIADDEPPPMDAKFLRKPFSVQAMKNIIREALDD